MLLNCLQTALVSFDWRTSIRRVSETITKEVENVSGSVGEFTIWSFTIMVFHFNFVSVHVELDAKMSFMESHQIADQIEDDFYREFGINICRSLRTRWKSIIQFVIELKEKVLDALKKYDANLEVHDFRIVKKKRCDSSVV